MTRTALVTLADYQHTPGAVVVMHSLCTRNPSMRGLDRWCITCDVDVLPPHVPGIMIHRVPVGPSGPYAGIYVQKSGMFSAFLRLEIFRDGTPFRDYDQVIVLDADTVVVGDVTPLLDCTEHALYGCVTDKTGYTPRLPPINTGVLVVNRSAMSYPGAWSEMIDMNRVNRYTILGDQQLVNRWRDQAGITTGYLPADEYNVFKQWYGTPRWAEHEQRHRIIHFIDGKPWLEPKQRAREAMSPGCKHCRKLSSWYTPEPLADLWREAYRAAARESNL